MVGPHEPLPRWQVTRLKFPPTTTVLPILEASSRQAGTSSSVMRTVTQTEGLYLLAEILLLATTAAACITDTVRDTVMM